MTSLFCVLFLLSGSPRDDELPQLLARAQLLHEQIGKSAREGQVTRSDARALLDVCIQLRRAAPTSLRLCLNEGNAAALAGDWPHALLAYRLAQRLAPYDPEVTSRLTAARERLVLPDQPPGVREEVVSVLGANSRVRASLWLMALLLYAMAWVRLAGLVSRNTGSGSGLALSGIGAAIAIVALMSWAKENRQQNLAQTLAVVRRGDPVAVREGNGLSYPAATVEQLKPGAEVIILGQRGAWLHVRTGHGLVGWVPARSAEVE